jgi:hypothetical protein
MKRLLCLLALGCGTQLPPSVPSPGRALCYASADQRAQARVNAECKDASGAVHFATCTTKDAIMAEQKTAQEACQ